jgi:hypothetical protein
VNRLIIGLVFLITLSTAYSKTMHSKLVISKNQVKTSDEIQLQFKIIPLNGMSYNTVGPSKLKLTSIGKDPKNILVKSKNEFDEKIPGFTVSLKSTQETGPKFDYKFISFVCTSDKSHCYRDVHKGTYQGAGT